MRWHLRGKGLILPMEKDVNKGILQKKLSDEEGVVFKNKLIELEGEFRKIFAIGSSIIREAIPVIELESAKEAQTFEGEVEVADEGDQENTKESEDEEPIVTRMIVICARGRGPRDEALASHSSNSSGTRSYSTRPQRRTPRGWSRVKN